jgi:hypothetical protein
VTIAFTLAVTTTSSSSSRLVVMGRAPLAAQQQQQQGSAWVCFSAPNRQWVCGMGPSAIAIPRTPSACFQVVALQGGRQGSPAWCLLHPVYVTRGGTSSSSSSGTLTVPLRSSQRFKQLCRWVLSLLCWVREWEAWVAQWEEQMVRWAINSSSSTIICTAEVSEVAWQAAAAYMASAAAPLLLTAPPGGPAWALSVPLRPSQRFKRLYWWVRSQLWFRRQLEGHIASQVGSFLRGLCSSGYSRHSAITSSRINPILVSSSSSILQRLTRQGVSDSAVGFMFATHFSIQADLLLRWAIGFWSDHKRVVYGRCPEEPGGTHFKWVPRKPGPSPAAFPFRLRANGIRRWQQHVARCQEKRRMAAAVAAPPVEATRLGESAAVSATAAPVSPVATSRRSSSGSSTLSGSSSSSSVAIQGSTDGRRSSSGSSTVGSSSDGGADSRRSSGSSSGMSWWEQEVAASALQYPAPSTGSISEWEQAAAAPYV